MVWEGWQGIRVGGGVLESRGLCSSLTVPKGNSWNLEEGGFLCPEFMDWSEVELFVRK